MLVETPVKKPTKRVIKSLVRELVEDHEEKKTSLRAGRVERTRKKVNKILRTRCNEKQASKILHECEKILQGGKSTAGTECNKAVADFLEKVFPEGKINREEQTTAGGRRDVVLRTEKYGCIVSNKTSARERAVPQWKKEIEEAFGEFSNTLRKEKRKAKFIGIVFDPREGNSPELCRKHREQLQEKFQGQDVKVIVPGDVEDTTDYFHMLLNDDL